MINWLLLLPLVTSIVVRATLLNQQPFRETVVQHNLCPDGTNQYSGYVPRSPLFFWLFESRSDPANDPLGIWLNGGPGSSSLSGMDFMGPCRVTEETKGQPKFEAFEWGWNGESNLLAVDNPKGAGFSTQPFPLANSTYTSAEDFYVFLQSFLKMFPQYNKHEIALNSLSYGGHYVPIYSSYLLHQNALLEDQRSPFDDVWPNIQNNNVSNPIPLNFRSASIGNGWFATPNQIMSWIGFVCGEAKDEGVPMLLTQEECDWSWQQWDQCETLLLETCEDHSRPSHECAAAGIFCQTGAAYHYVIAGDMNPYDYRDDNPYSGDPVTRFYNNASVQYQLGVISDLTKPVKWESHNSAIGTAFSMSSDFWNRTDFLVARLLGSGLDILIYEGMRDWICNYIGVRDVVSSLPSYAHQQAFNDLAYTLWEPFLGEGRKGAYKCLKGGDKGKLCYLEIDESGHSVAYYKPREAYQMATSWMKKRVV